jgi:hypothetical protein
MSTDIETTPLDVVAEAAEAPLDVVREVLWHLGDTNLGQQPGSFFTALLVAADRADGWNRLKLTLVYPEYMYSLRAAREVSIDVLRDRVKAATSPAVVPCVARRTKTLAQGAGDMAVYELTPPFRMDADAVLDHVVVSSVDLPILLSGYRTEETMIFASDGENVTDWGELVMVPYKSHEDALRELGYEVLS